VYCLISPLITLIAVRFNWSAVNSMFSVSRYSFALSFPPPFPLEGAFLASPSSASCRSWPACFFRLLASHHCPRPPAASHLRPINTAPLPGEELILDIWLFRTFRLRARELDVNLQASPQCTGGRVVPFLPFLMIHPEYSVCGPPRPLSTSFPVSLAFPSPLFSPEIPLFAHRIFHLSSSNFPFCRAQPGFPCLRNVLLPVVEVFVWPRGFVWPSSKSLFL